MQDAPATLAALLRHVRSGLAASGNSEAGLDARLIVEHATGAARLDFITRPELAVSTGEAASAMAMLGRRVAGEPVHRILGHREFHGLHLTLSRETLEPRPDTEALVELALPFVRDAAERHGECRILDLGTGTGAVALALLAGEKRARSVGAEISADALATAIRNADINGLSDRFDALASDWYSAVEGWFHIIVSNPPYIRSRDIDTLSPEVRLHDPRAALDGGDDGLDAYRVIAAGAAQHLGGGGIVAVEMGHDQERDVKAIFAGQNMAAAGSAADLGGHVRALAFVRK